MSNLIHLDLMTMAFKDRLAALRKERNLTQQALADMAEIHVAQIRRYESGETQPALDIIRRLAIALHISADLLVFDEDERGPNDNTLRLQLEAINQFDEEDRQVAHDVLEGLILKHQAKQSMLRRNR